MIPVFFGSAQRQLFGTYRLPAPGAPERGAAVLCPPWGQEYLVSHRLYHRLAARLAEEGYHVFRFDYFGTGDSGGTRHDGDLDSWTDDAASALDEVRDMSGARSVVIFGIRIGAAVAWRHALRNPEISTVVLWDPVVSGTEYLSEMENAQADIDRFTLRERRAAAPASPTPHLLGFPLTTAMRRSIEAVRLDDFDARSMARVELFFSQETPVAGALEARLRAAGNQVHAETLVSHTPWYLDEEIGAAAVPVLVVERMLERLR